MPQNFIESRREQGFLLPPDVREWLAPDHLAWFVIDAVKDMDLRAFYAAYRADGHGAAAYEPSVMVTVILFAFATGVRSSRAIERHCREHVAFRVITGNLVPDHVTVARFVCRHEQALSGLFTDVLKLCHEAGLVKSGVVSIDGTRIAGNANPDVNFHFEQIAREVLAEVRATDEAEDQELGEARGDELPEQLRTAEGRREFLRQARERLLGDDPGAERLSEDAGAGGEAGEEAIGELEADAADEEPEDCALTEQSGGEAENDEPERRSTPEFEFDPSHITDAGGGRRRWLQDARSQLEQHRWDNPDPILRSRIDRLVLALERLEAELAAERAGNEAYEEYRQQGRMRDGRRFGRPPDPHQPPEVPEGKVNVTDPDSRPIPIGFGFVQGYNAQTAVNEAADRARGGNHQPVDRFLAAVPDGRGRAPGARSCGHRSQAARGGRRRRRLLERAADGRRRQQPTPPSAGRARQGQPRHPQALAERAPGQLDANCPDVRPRSGAIRETKTDG